MRVNFPEVKDHLPSDTTLFRYKHLAELHLFLFKQRSIAVPMGDCAGFFLLTAFICFLLQAREIIPNAFVGILIAGVGFLLLSVSNLRIDVEYGIMAAAYAEKGASIEKKYDTHARLFGIFEDNKSIAYRGSLLSRLFPMSIIGLVTIIAGTILAMKVCTWLAIVIVLISLFGMHTGARSYIKIVRKVMLEGCNEFS